MVDYRGTILKSIEKATGGKKIDLEVPENIEHGDYSTNVAMQMASKEKGGNPRNLAQELVNKLNSDKKLLNTVDKVEVAGPGFINFYLNKETLVDTLVNIAVQFDTYGSSETGKDKTVVIDYSSPNIAKPFGIGHLSSTIIGQALYNIYTFMGYKVIGDNHLGDWGTQFGKLLYKLQDFKIEKVKNLAIKDLEQLYVDFHKEAKEKPELEEKAREWFKKLEGGDKKARELWKLCVDVSMKEFERIYGMLGVKIDHVYGESFYEDEIKKLLNDPKVQKKLKNGEDGAKIIDLTESGINTPLMFLKSDGATTYATRDLACINFRVGKWNPDLIIYEVGVQQKFYFQQVFAAVRLLGLVRNDVELYHTNHGWYLGADGKKFSTREGKTVKLEGVLDEAIDRAKKLGSVDDVTANQVGIGAIKYFNLMRSVQTNVVFNWENVMNMEGNSGPYIQYTYARAQSVLDKAKVVKDKNIDIEPNAEESAVLRTLIHFPEIVSEAAEKYSPNLICNYLYDLAQKYNTFYNTHKIIGGEHEDLGLSISSATGIVLKNGLRLLGIKAPKRM